MILIIDNYDSFTYNLGQYVGELGFNPLIVRNDKISIEKIKKIGPTHIIISPGPGKPEESGISLEIINQLSQSIPILGICLGHQSIGYIYGSKIRQLDLPIHGKITNIYHNKQDIFKDMPNPFMATRYHSLVIDMKNLPADIEVTAKTQDGLIMGCAHKQYPLVRGIQFHPESLWTTNGRAIINNFLSNDFRAKTYISC